MAVAKVALRSHARLAELTRLLLWEGQISRARVMSLHSLSPVRASEWIRELRERHPRWTRWDSVSRSYFVTENAYRQWEQRADSAFVDADGGFSRYMSEAGVEQMRSGLEPAPIASAFPDLVAPEPRIFAPLYQAINKQQALTITYRSMNRPEPHERNIEPRALARAGPRWHVRAYCRETEDFRDYSLGRIVSVLQNASPLVAINKSDLAWDTVVRVVLQPHPQLSAAQADLVRFEYFKGNSARTESCRGALLHYTVQHIRAAINIATEKPPEFHLVVTNVEEVKPWLFRG